MTSLSAWLCGLYAAHAAATAAFASAESDSKITMWVSGSGGCSTTIPFVVATDHPPGAVKVAPPDVVRGESTDTCSAAAVAGAVC